ncbi:hypothetical protein SUGI_0725120 [Cryptomeria japonica]|nr:hypothetical protein SUGI_0725120 [Cryptomeria japonica]
MVHVPIGMEDGSLLLEEIQGRRRKVLVDNCSLRQGGLSSKSNEVVAVRRKQYPSLIKEEMPPFQQIYWQVSDLTRSLHHLSLRYV